MKILLYVYMSTGTSGDQRSSIPWETELKAVSCELLDMVMELNSDPL